MQKPLPTDNTPNEKTTIYLDPKVKKGTQYYALRKNTSLSEIINRQLMEFLEDQADIAALEEREGDLEFVDFDQALRELGIDAESIHGKTGKARR